MTDFRKEYDQKLVRPEEAVKLVQSGDWVDYAHSTSVPVLLDRALAARAEELEDVNIRGYLVYHPLAIFEANDRVGRRVFTFNSWHFGGIERKQVEKGYAFFIPMRYCELPEMYRRKEDIERVDVLMLQTAKMDAFGNFNLGPANSQTMEVVRRAKHIIVEENENIPYVPGLYDESIPLSKVDAIVSSREPVDVLGNAKPSEIDRKIAELVLKEIPDGATLQLGIGGMPNAVGELISQSDLKDLGVHTEMYVDSMMKMTQAGIITGQKKSRDRGKQVFAFGAGSKELYEFMDHNPVFASAPVDYVNSPQVIASFDNFISINNAIELDLYGQINGESSGMRQISGTGGQLDFVIGAYHSHGGKSIMALSSTFTNKKGETKSRILPTLKEGSIVTDPRTTAHYVATEYGIVNLRGKSTWQRAEALISIAHPDFRDQLIQEAGKMHIWRKSNQR